MTIETAAQTRHMTPFSQTSPVSSEKSKHLAMVVVELEVMAMKVDRFGWDRARGTPIHDRLVRDWVEALQGFPLDQIRAACAAWVRSNPRKMPNEGDILGLLRPKPKASTFAQQILQDYRKDQK